MKVKLPELRFPDFDNSWVKKSIGNVCTYTNGKAHEQEIDSEGDYIVVNSKFISTQGEIRKYTNDAISPLEKGDVVMVLSDVPNGKALAKCYYIDKNDKYTLNQRICALTSKKLDNKFLYYRIDRNKYFLMFDSGVGQTNLRKSEVLDCLIYVPNNIKEQQKIADFLSSVDQKIQQLRQKKELLEEYKKGVMQKLFSQEIRFKDEKGEDFPDWEDKRLEEILDINYGKDYKDLDEGNIPLIGTGGILGYVDDFLYDKPSVLIGRKGTIDKPQYIEKPFWTVDTLFYTKVNKSVDPYFAYLLVSRINLLKYNEASGVPSLSVRSLNSIKVKLPASFKEQLRIANFVKNIDEKISHIEVKIELTQIFKKGLLQKMFV